MGHKVDSRNKIKLETKNQRRIVDHPNGKHRTNTIVGIGAEFGVDADTALTLANSGEARNPQDFRDRIAVIGANVSFQANPTRAAGLGSSLSTQGALQNLAASQLGLRRSVKRPGFFFDPRTNKRGRSGAGTFILPRPGISSTALSELDDDTLLF